MRTLNVPLAVAGARLLRPATVTVEGRRIVSVREGRASGSTLPDGVLVPGLIDLQLNGMFGVDFQTAAAEEWVKVQESLPSTGVTAFLPTLITAPLDALGESLGVAAEVRRWSAGHPRSRLLGTHVEGPFLSPLRRGAHNPDWLLNPTAERISTLLECPAGPPMLITLAPELDGAMAAVERLVDRGVAVSIGHSDATAEQVSAAASAGARMVTHLFNAQRGIHHREPGVAGQGLADPRLTLGLIADLAHVVGPVLQLAFAAASGRIALVSDAAAAAGQPPGRYLLGGEVIEVADEGPPRRADGTLAGSALRLDQSIANVVGLGIDLVTAVDAASRVPADLFGLRELGRLAPGALADMVWLGDDLRTRACWIGGELAFGEVDW